MIRFLTEDKEDSPFVKLFNAAYPEEVLYCSGGNGELVDWARSLADAEHKVLVYMDMVPDNREIKHIYNALLDLYYTEKLDVLVLPIVCAEYAFIKSVVGVGKTIYSQSGLNVILNKSLQYVSLAGSGTHSSKNFEKFCKSFCKRCLNKECCSVESNEAALKQPYFADSCAKCEGCSVKFTLARKSSLFLAQYPVIPSLSTSGLGVLSWTNILNISYRLVDEFNYWCEINGFDRNTVAKRI